MATFDFEDLDSTWRSHGNFLLLIVCSAEKPFQPGHHYAYRLPADKTKDWYASYSINIKEGKEHCSPRSVAFHYIKGDMMKRLHAMFYHLCPEEYLKR